jgi:hypothetical protein
MIQAYIDETGTDEQAKIVAMVGFVSSYKRWRKFDREWNEVLNPPDEINPPTKRRVFHATDCMGKDGHRAFADWSKEKRNLLVDSLIPIARRRTLFAFGSAFSVHDYKSIVPTWIKKKWTHPYYLCFFHLANLLDMNRAEFTFPKDEKIAFTIAHKPKFVGLMTSLYDEVKENTSIGSILGKMTPHGEPAEDIPIQSADLICYLVRTFWEKEHFAPGSAHRRTCTLMANLLARDPAIGSFRFLEPHFLGPEALKGFVRAYEETHQEAGDWEWNPNVPTGSKRG